VESGAKILCLTVPSLQIRFIDSLSFLPFALRKFPKAFGLDSAKGFFPHLFTSLARFGYVGDRPEPEAYCPDYMGVTERVEFLSWYAEVKDEVFDFDEELLKYCVNDVKVLRQGCASFRRQSMGVTQNRLDVKGIDPFSFFTLASFVNYVYRRMFMPLKTIGIVPPLGYNVEDKTSNEAIKYLDFVAMTSGQHIAHAKNGGEKRFGNLKVDGWCEARNTVFEYQGCFWHGCEACYPRELKNPYNGLTMKELREKTRQKVAKLEARGLTVDEMWSCQWKNVLKDEPEVRAMEEFYTDPLNPRDAFFGECHQLETSIFCLYTHDNPYLHVFSCF
jgi:hypothetical protein